MNEFFDRFSSHQHGLRLPTGDKDQIARYVAQTRRDDSAENVPFKRQVDFWAFSIVTALTMKLEPLADAPTKWGTVFIYSTQGVMNNDLCSLLAVVAIDRMGIDNHDFDDPAKIIDMSNRLAGAGCPVVLRHLSDSSLRTTPLDRAITLARSLITEVRSKN